MKYTIALLLFTVIVQTVSQNFNTLFLTQINDVKYQCVDSSCSPPTIISISTLRACQIACLSDTNCRTLTYDQSTNHCELFANIPSQYGSIVVQAGVVTFTAIGELQQLSRMTTIVTTFTTSATTAATITTTATTTTSSTTTTTTISTTTAYMYGASSLWRFDNNTLDSIGNLNGVAINSPAFVKPGIIGSGYALSLNRNNTQYVTIATYQNLSYVSFTVEMWIYLTSLNKSTYGLFSQRDSATTDHLLILMVFNSHLYISFYSDDAMGATLLSTNTWYHAAFVYDYPSLTQIVYLNGYQDVRRTTAGPYLGMTGAITIGMYIDYLNTIQCFDGYIDQVSLTMRTKNPTEILTDATLTTWHSFDSIPFYDSGPLGLNATAVNVTLVSGRVNQALSFTSNSSYYQVNGFVLLGISGHSYSISLWIKRATINGATLVHLSTTTDGLGWCVDLMGFSSSGQIIATGWHGSGQQVVGPILLTNIWTHVVSTYSPTNGVRLYVNGTLTGTTGAMSYFAAEDVTIITLANPLQATTGVYCNSMSISTGVYYGYLDEFRVYSRELNATDVYALANL